MHDMIRPLQRFLTICSVLIYASASWADERVALVIGNSEYEVAEATRRQFLSWGIIGPLRELSPQFKRPEIGGCAICVKPHRGGRTSAGRRLRSQTRR